MTRTTTIQLVYDTDPGTPNGIEAFIHCARCLDEWEGIEGLAPRDYAWTQIGVRADGNLQVWCNRHACNVAVIRPRLKRTRKTRDARASEPKGDAV